MTTELTWEKRDGEWFSNPPRFVIGRRMQGRNILFDNKMEVYKGPIIRCKGKAAGILTEEQSESAITEITLEPNQEESLPDLQLTN